MNREIIKFDSDHNIERIVCQSTTERDAQLRIFPWPKLSTHVLDYRWADPMTYEVFVRPHALSEEVRDAVLPTLKEVDRLAAMAVSGKDVKPGLTALLGDLRKLLGLALKVPAVGEPPPSAGPDPSKGEPREILADPVALAKLKRADLVTVAAEAGIQFDSKLSNAQAAAFVSEGWTKKKAGV